MSDIVDFHEGSSMCCCNEQCSVSLLIKDSLNAYCSKLTDLSQMFNTLCKWHNVCCAKGDQWSDLNLPPSSHAPALQRHHSPSCCSLIKLFLLYLPPHQWSHTVFLNPTVLAFCTGLQDTGTNFCIFFIFCRELSKRLNSWKRKVNLWWLYVKSAALRKILKPMILLR